MTRHPVQIGFAGVATEWLQQLPTLQRHQRMRIAAVFDTTPAAAMLAASHWQSAHIKGFVKLLESPLIEAVVLGNPSWMGWQAARMCVERGVAALLVVSRLSDAAFFDSRLPAQLQLELAMSYARGRATLLMPGLALRWLPATIRARELTATKLGAIESLHIQAPGLPLKSRQVAELLDWGLHLVQSAPASVEVVGSDRGYELRLHCRRPRKDGQPVQIQMQGLTLQSVENDAAIPDFQATGTCRHGEFRLTAADQIRHVHERTAQEEHLVADRSSFDVMLDLFGRRLVGGVVPIPDLNDVLRARQLVLAAQYAQEHRELVAVNEEGRHG